MERRRKTERPRGRKSKTSAPPSRRNAPATLGPVCSDERYDRLSDALAALKLNRSDARLIHTSAVHAGLPQRELGEWIRVERRTPAEARAAPLKRSHRPRERIADRAAWLTDTIGLPSSGRVVQVQRHYADADALHATLAARTKGANPSLVIREVLVDPAPLLASCDREKLVAELDAATVVLVTDPSL